MSLFKWLFDTNDAIAEKSTELLDLARRTPERVLKDNGFDTLGNAFETVNNTLDSIGNVNRSMTYKRFTRNRYTAQDLNYFHPGDHLLVYRSIYTHHAIYIGNAQVIEFDDYELKKSSLDDFADGDDICIENDACIYTSQEVVQRALHRYNTYIKSPKDKRESYNVFFNNCQNFATWCRNGSKDI